MKGNRRADTKPEVALRSSLHARGLRFRKDLLVRTESGVKSKVDVVFPRRRVAVFVDGCFWHGCPEHGRVPSTNPHYWPSKLARNRLRDLRVTAALERDGWTVLRFWEHEPVDVAIERILQAITSRADPAS